MRREGTKRMIVFNLGCTHSHLFEGWFSNAQDFDSQKEKGYLSCPMCGDLGITKRLSAPRLNLAKGKAPAAQEKTAQEPAAPVANQHPTIEQMQSLWYKMATQILRDTEDVGDRFADEARKIHYNEVPARGIRGHASQDQREQLADEGIDVYSMPIPDALKEPLQ
jgi:hypothetical protein